MQKVQESTGDNRNQVDIGQNLLPFEFCAFLQAGTCVRPEKNQLNNDESAGIHDIFLAEQSLNQRDDERSCIAVYDVDLLHDIQFKRPFKDSIEDQKHDMHSDHYANRVQESCANLRRIIDLKCVENNARHDQIYENYGQNLLSEAFNSPALTTT